MTRTWVLCAVIAAAAAVHVRADSAAGLEWTPPAGWKSQGSQPLRAATYLVGPAAGDTSAAECGVYFFGAGQGGSVEANLDRWKGQFRTPDGKPANGRVARRSAAGLTITTLDIAGTYSGLGGPLASSARAAPGYRLLGAIVQGPGGNIFVKFTGPARTIAANQQKFEQLLTSFRAVK